jgi:protein SCO1
VTLLAVILSRRDPRCHDIPGDPSCAIVECLGRANAAPRTDWADSFERCFEPHYRLVEQGVREQSVPLASTVVRAVSFIYWRRSRWTGLSLRMTISTSVLSLGCILLAGFAGFGVAHLLRPHAPQPALATGSFLASPRTLPDFTLIDLKGQPFGTKNLLGHWSLVVFGYTSCSDYCPTTLTTLAAIHKRLRANGTVKMPTVIFMSMDAKRDTPAHLAKYVPYFDPEFIAVTAADQPRIEEVARKLGVSVIIESGADANYTVDHSTAIYVVEPDAKLAAVLTGPFTVDALQADFQRIVGRDLLR